MTEIWKSFTFDSAHYLPHVPTDHKCAYMHGHTYTVTIRLAGPLTAGWVRDFADIKEAFSPVAKLVDHRVLNDVLPNPTAEMLAEFIWQQISPGLPELSAVEVSETATSGATYRGTGGQ